MSALWTAAQAARATDGETTRDWSASGISIDTRTLQPGDLFVALTAARDGHEFVAQALDMGAVAALVSYRPENVARDAPLLIVPDVQAGLEDLGRAGRARTTAKVLAITGSVGKTSAKDMARAALAPLGKVHAAQASYNNHWGVPLTLARMPVDTDFAVIEIGMSNPGEIAPLARLAKPDVALITTVAPAHLEAFGSLTEIAEEKASVFEGLSAGAGTAVINADLATTGVLEARARARNLTILRFGYRESASWRMLDTDTGERATTMRANSPEGKFSVTLAAPGEHVAQNALGVLAACHALGAPLGGLIDGIGAWCPPTGRGTRELVPFPGGDLILIDDAFNSNPASLAASLDVFALLQGADRKILILGDMMELGPAEVGLHTDIAAHPTLSQIAKVHCVGSRMAHLWSVLPKAKRGEQAAIAEEMLPRLPDLIEPGDAVLIKGSKGSRVSLCVDRLRALGLETSVQ